MTGCQLLVRPRLIELAAERWYRRVVAIVAGPGFGKSVLLAQAAAENRLAPRGVDLPVACVAADRAPAAFMHRLATAIDGGSGATRARPEWLVAELGRRWPLGVCLVIDDVHHVTSTDDGERLLRRLIAEAPPAVHFMLASRRRVRGLAAARAGGEVVDIGEHDLALSGAEVAALANAHDVAPAVVAPVAGWPAVASLAAAYGVDHGSEYVWDAVLDHLDRDERRTLALAASIGSGDAELLQAAIGGDPAALLTRVPLVTRGDDDEFTIHELWHRVVGDEVTNDERRDAIAGAVEVLASRGAHDRAFTLSAAHDLWDAAFGVLIACCRQGAADVSRDVLASWLAALPERLRDEPGGLLLRGLVGRVNDPFGPATIDVLERAAAHYRAAGNVTGEVAAIGELAYVLRNQGGVGEMCALLARVAELDTGGHREVAGLMALMRSVEAEFAGDDHRMIAELGTAPEGSLTREWQSVVAFRRAIGHLTLGQQDEMLDAATRCSELAGSTTPRHVLPLARWYAGDPQSALDACAAIAGDADRSTVDAVALGSFATMVLASAGRLEEASARLAATERAASAGCVVALMRGYVVGIKALVAAARGDDDGARDTIQAALAETPLTSPQGWHVASRWLPLAYVLVPAVRSVLDVESAGLHARRLAVARAVATAREGGPIEAAVLEQLSPGLVATTVPLPWAMELAGRLHADDSSRGRELAESLIELFGQPAREALRDAGGHVDGRIAAGARQLLAAIAIAPHVVELDVLGPAVLRIDGEQRTGLDWQRERVRALLLFLVVNGAARREQIIDALWPDLDAAAADRNLRVTLAYLQRVLEPDRRKGEMPFFIRQSGAVLSLAGAPHLTVDAHEFTALVDQAEEADRRGIPSVALELLDQALARWRGRCLEDVAFAEWAQPMGHELTERFVTAATRAAELNLAAGRTREARRHARRALAADEWAEPAHRVLIAAALADGDRGGAARALAACEAMLTDLGVEPSAETQMLSRRLRAPVLSATA